MLLSAFFIACVVAAFCIFRVGRAETLADLAIALRNLGAVFLIVLILVFVALYDPDRIQDVFGNR